MKKLLFIITVFCAQEAIAQTYLINFTGTGESTVVNSVKVENLTKGISAVLNGNDILRLTLVTGVNELKNNQISALKIYPNPTTDYSTIEIFPPQPGAAKVSVIDMTGKQVAQISIIFENIKQTFKLSGLKNGFYVINIKGNDFQSSGKLLSTGNSNGAIRIEKVNDIIVAPDEKQIIKESKGTQATQATVDMAYTIGDRLKYTGTSGIYSTVKTDIPAGDKTISFNFIACTDGDNINYQIVEIGTQVWMAENLKTTKYRNGDLIGTTTPATLDITGESTPKYQWAYNGNESNVVTYGRLYTWYTVTDIRNVCPTGWHLPTDEEWTTLTDYLANNGYGYEGSGTDIAKSLAASSGWTIRPDAGVVGNNQSENNSSGFTALPGGDHAPYGPFDGLGWEARWWSDSSFVRYLYSTNSNVTSVSVILNSGASVRCVRQ